MKDNRENKQQDDMRAQEQDGSYKNSDKNAHHQVNNEPGMNKGKDNAAKSERSGAGQQQNAAGIPNMNS